MWNSDDKKGKPRNERDAKSKRKDGLWDKRKIGEEEKEKYRRSELKILEEKYGELGGAENLVSKGR